MAETKRKQLRWIDAPFIVLGPSGVAIRDRLKGLTPQDEEVLCLVGAHLGSLASKDLKRCCVDGLEHSTDTWAERKRSLTEASSSRWAGSVTTNARYGRYVLASKAAFAYRGQEWRDRIEADRAVAYRIHDDVEHGRWYLTASWQRPVVTTVPLATARAKGMAGVDTNADHFAAYRLDRHGNPVGDPRRFFYDLSGSADHRDAQVRHAISQLLHWADRCGVKAIGLENLDFAAEKTREKHGRRKRFRQLISGIPTGKLKARLVSMASEHGLSIVAVDPAYTSMWGDQHWKKPLTSKKRKMSRHDAAGIAIGRRALGHPIRRRTAPPPQHQSDAAGHRTAQAGPGARGREGTRPPVTERAHDARSRTGTQRTRETSASNTVRDARSSGSWQQMSLLDTV
jgi:IS605 OrfB family transposase